MYYSFRFLSLNQPLTMWKKNVIVNCFPLQQSCDSSANEIKGKLQTVSLPINLRNEKSLPPVSSQQQVKIHRFRAGYFYIVSFSYKLSNRTETWPRGNKTGEKNEVLSAAIQRTFSGRSCHPIRWDGSGWLLGSTMARSAGAAAGPMRVCPPPRLSRPDRRVKSARKSGASKRDATFYEGSIFHLWTPSRFKLVQLGGIRLRQKPQAPTPQAPVRNHQTGKVANAKVRIG